MALKEIVRQTTQRFAQRYGRAPQVVVAAPGRVNLIGEHTDYNEGHVLPAAIERYTVLAASRRVQDEDSNRFYSAMRDESGAFAGDGQRTHTEPNWLPYVRGVWQLLSARWGRRPCVDALIDSDLPIGAGLSSSAALTAASATLWCALSLPAVDELTLAKICQQAEHEFAGVPCGLMDPLCSLAGRGGNCLHIDCRSEAIRYIPLPPGVGILIVDSRVHHDLAQGKYAERRAECREAAKAFGVSSLRDLTSAALESSREKVPGILVSRARHVVRENERVLEFCRLLEQRDWQGAGELMWHSHASLRDDYDVSCRELDLLVALAEGIGPRGGVFGSRMTGGGFGGCTVSLIDPARLAEIQTVLEYKYFEATGLRPEVFVSRPAEGASVLLRDG